MVAVLNNFLIVCALLVILIWLMLLSGVLIQFYEDFRLTVISLAPEDGELRELLRSIIQKGGEGCRIGIFHRSAPVSAGALRATAAGKPIDPEPRPRIHFSMHTDDNGQAGLNMTVPLHAEFNEAAAGAALERYNACCGTAFSAFADDEGSVAALRIPFGQDALHAAGFTQFIRPALFGPAADTSFLLYREDIPPAPGKLDSGEAEPAPETIDLPKRTLRAFIDYLPEWRKSEAARDVPATLLLPVVIFGLVGLLFSALMKLAAWVLGWETDWAVISLDFGVLRMHMPDHELLFMGLIIGGLLAATGTQTWKSTESGEVDLRVLNTIFAALALIMITLASWFIPVSAGP